MKHLNFFFYMLLLHCTSIMNAQSIPNGSFEEWVICGDPNLWYTNNQYWPPLQCVQIYPDFQAFSGNICAMGVVDSCSELSVLYPPILTSHDIILSAKPEALHIFYKYFPVGGDLFFVNIKLYKDSVCIGEGTLKLKNMVTVFTEFVVNFDYTSSDIPDVAVIKFTIDNSLNDNQLHQGSTWYLDSLTFGPLSDISNENTEIPTTINLYQNYPNPFNPTTTIKFQLPEMRFVTLRVFDALGSEIETLVNEEKPAGTYEITWYVENLPSGIYFYQLRAENRSISSRYFFVETKKMMLMK